MRQDRLYRHKEYFWSLVMDSGERRDWKEKMSELLLWMMILDGEIEIMLTAGNFWAISV